MAEPLVVGNWKMNTTREDANALARAIASAVSGTTGVEVVVCPPFPWLTDIASVLAGTGVALGAQNIHTESGGGYTGEVSARMLRGLCEYVLVGQYERRVYSSEKDAILRRKLRTAQQNGIKPILCVGETADQLDEGSGPYVVAEQIEADLEDVALTPQLVIAYEPVWTTMGRVAPPPVSYVADMIAHMRSTLFSVYSAEVAEQTRLLYGGQLNMRNIGEIAASAGIDGVLAGTASTNAANFVAIIEAFRTRPPGPNVG